MSRLVLIVYNGLELPDNVPSTQSYRHGALPCPFDSLHINKFQVPVERSSVNEAVSHSASCWAIRKLALCYFLASLLVMARSSLFACRYGGPVRKRIACCLHLRVWFSVITLPWRFM